MTTVPCLRCNAPLTESPTTVARIYLCLPCIEALGGEKKAKAALRREWRTNAPAPSPETPDLPPIGDGIELDNAIRSGAVQLPTPAPSLTDEEREGECSLCGCPLAGRHGEHETEVARLREEVARLREESDMAAECSTHNLALFEEASQGRSAALAALARARSEGRREGRREMREEAALIAEEPSFWVEDADAKRERADRARRIRALADEGKDGGK